MTSRVVILLIDDEDFAWEVLNAASEQDKVIRALMVNVDHPEPIASIIADALQRG